MKKRGFVFCVCGNQQVERVNRALQFLKRFSKLDIIVAKARTYLPVYHDQLLECRVPDEFTNQAAATSLKTALHRMLPTDSAEWCYLDPNVIAVDSDVDHVFDRRRGRVAFAADTADTDSQSPSVMNCGCRQRRCRHLRQAIRETFSAKINSGEWIPWKTGLFVFGSESLELLDLWHQNAALALSSSTWSGRDQWALAAAVWKLGLNNKPTLPRRFCRIVDGFRGIPPDRREGLTSAQLFVDSTYSLDAQSSRKPAFLHFVGGAAGIEGWKNWDDVNRLIRSNGHSPAAKKMHPPAVITERRGSLTPVHGMWIGSSLSRLELLTLKSFVRQGHRFHLWLYDQLTTPVPDGVVLEDATEILPRSAVFKRRAVDPNSGVGQGSYGAPFSDLFRYKLLHDKGGYWSDMDVTCLKPFPSDTPYLFRSHRIGVVGNVMKCPRGSRLMAETFEQTLRIANEDSEWLLPNKILSENIKRLELSGYIRTNFCNADSWPEVVQPFIENDYDPPDEWYAIHWLNEVWRTLGQNGGQFKGRALLKYRVDKDLPKEGTTLARLYKKHGLYGVETFSDRNGTNGSNHHATARNGVFDITGSTTNGNNSGKPMSAPRAQLASRNHINVLIPTLALGGAERIVVDTLTALGQHRRMFSESCTGVKAGTLFVMGSATPAYSDEIPNIEIVNAASVSSRRACELVATRVLRSGTPNLFVHLGSEQLLSSLWEDGVRTIPVVHNSSPGWPCPATTYNHLNVPFVVAVCEAVARELREHGCMKRIVVIRHQIDRPVADDLVERRGRIRARHGIDEDTLLIGMVGQFKLQKDYPKAVRVLASVRKRMAAKLIILGPWDHSWGDGRQAFAETYKTACDLEVVADLITAGAVTEVEDYYPAFDVLLSTSSYEGLSISMMEAESFGCPIVSSSVGGAAEIESNSVTLLPPDAEPEQFADAIINAGLTSVPATASHADGNLVPQLWNLLGQFSDPQSYLTNVGQAACIVDYLNAGTVNSKLAQRFAASNAIQYIFCTDSVDTNLDRSLRSHGVQIFDMKLSDSLGCAAESVLRAVQELGVRKLYIAGLDCRLRLLLAKILPPEAVEMYDTEGIEGLFQKMSSIRGFQRQIVFDESDYFRRISPWSNSLNSIPGH